MQYAVHAILDADNTEEFIDVIMTMDVGWLAWQEENRESGAGKDGGGDSKYER